MSSDNPADPDDNWTVAQGEDDGMPILFRFRSQRPTGVVTQHYPNLIAMAWHYDPSNMGMPSQEEVASMELLEELLQPALETPRQAFLTLVVTGNGVREWQWYARDPHHTMQLLNAALSGYDPFPIEISFEDDPQWEGYYGIQKMIQG